MQLKELRIARNIHSFTYDNLQPGATGGNITFTGDGGEVTVRLKQHHVAAILAIVADSMVQTTRELSDSLTREVIEHAQTALPSPAADAGLDLAAETSF